MLYTIPRPARRQRDQPRSAGAEPLGRGLRELETVHPPISSAVALSPGLHHLPTVCCGLSPGYKASLSRTSGSAISPPYQVLLKSCPCKPKADISLLPPPIPLATRTPSGLFPLPPQRSPRSETPVWTARERPPAPATRIRTAPSQFAARLNRTSGRSTTYALPVLTSIHCSPPPPL